MITFTVNTAHGWADVIAMVRDLLGEKYIVWQDRTGKVGIIRASEAEVRTG